MKLHREDLLLLPVAFVGIVLVAQAVDGLTAPPSAAHEAPALATCDRLENVVVTDADTVRADVMLGRGVVLVDRPIRLEGFDAWESRRGRPGVVITDEEIRKGKLATAALRGLLDDTTEVLLTQGSTRDPYGRCVGRLRLVQQDGAVIAVETWMREHGHDRGTEG